MRVDFKIKKYSGSEQVRSEDNFQSASDSSRFYAEKGKIPTALARNVSDILLTALPLGYIGANYRRKAGYLGNKTIDEQFTKFAESFNKENYNVLFSCKNKDDLKEEAVKLLDNVLRMGIDSAEKLNQLKVDLSDKQLSAFYFYVEEIPKYVNDCQKTPSKIKEKKSYFKKNKNSINKNSQSMSIHNNKTGYHNEYYQDALKGSGKTDSLISAFYKSMQEEYHKDLNIKPQKRGDLMDFFYEEEHIMRKAHPDSIVIADAREGGELLENNLEKHKKLVDIARRKPSGNFR